MNNNTLLEKYLDIKRIKKEGNWMVRMDNDGISHGGFKWNQIGEWTEAPDWNSSEICGGGLHGQGPKGFGFSSPTGIRFCFCETDGNHISVGGNKIKVKRARIMAVDEEAFELLMYVCDGNFPGSLNLSYYDHHLPETFTHCGGDLDLAWYKHPLPNSFTHCGGDLYLENYGHPLPKGFTHCGGDLILSGGDLILNGYKHQLPNSFTYCGGSLYLAWYEYPLPKGFTHCDGDLNLENYEHPLPNKFIHCGGHLDLSCYNHPLPKGFTHCDGDLNLSFYNHPLPKGFTHCDGAVFGKDEHIYSLPENFIEKVKFE